MPPAAAPSPLSEYLVAKEPGRRERAENWRVAIGLQKVDGLEVSPYLVKTARRNIEGEISAEDARRIVRQYYEEKPPGADPEAHGEADHTSTNINAILAEPAFRLSPEYYIGLHRRIFAGVFPFAGKLRTVNLTKKEWVLGLVAPPASGVNKPDVTNHVGINVGINVGIKLSPQEQRAKDLLVADPTLSAPKLGARLGVTGRQAERIVSSLKTKSGLRRVGSRKTGRWEFPSHPAT